MCTQRTHILFCTPCRWLIVRFAKVGGHWVPFLDVDKVIDEPPPPLQTQRVVESWSGRRTYTLTSYLPDPHYTDVVVGVWEPDGVENPNPAECLYTQHCTASAKERAKAVLQWKKIEQTLDSSWDSLNAGNWEEFRRHLRALRRVFTGTIYWSGLDTRIAYEYPCVARQGDSLAYATPIGLWWTTGEGCEFRANLCARAPRQGPEGRPRYVRRG